MTSPSGLVVNRRGPPQLRHGRARGPSVPPRSPVLYLGRSNDREGPRSASVCSTNWNEESQDEQTAAIPFPATESSSGAPHDVQGGPAVGMSAPSADTGPVSSWPDVPGADPTSSIPSTRVNECPHPAQEPFNSWAGRLANSICAPQSGHVFDTDYRPQGAAGPSLGDPIPPTCRAHASRPRPLPAPRRNLDGSGGGPGSR